MKLIIDLTNLLNANFITGIQSVVRKVVPCLIASKRFEIVLIQHIPSRDIYTIVTNEDFLNFVNSDSLEWDTKASAKIFYLSSLNSGDIFFDIDAVWFHENRNSLYKKLKDNGVKIATYVYDINPITSPAQYHSNPLLFYMRYLGAVLKYSDLIFSETQFVLDEISKLKGQLSLDRNIKMEKTWLGCDFNPNISYTNDLPAQILNLTNQHKFILQVGTLSPHKNHKLILDAFDNTLFDKGLAYVIAGKRGWNNDDLINRIENHPLINKQLFFFENVDNYTLTELYKRAYALAFPSKIEGFGLPPIESMLSGTPVFSSDIPVLKEVCGEYAEFININDITDFSNKVLYYLDNPREYANWKSKLKHFHRTTWEEVAQTIENSLISLKSKTAYNPPETIRQIVYLSARIEDLLPTLPFIENFMPFIEELVVCCPDKMAFQMKAEYKGRLKLICITDSQLLDGKPLPEDHQARNFFLRCLMVQRPEINDIFIMSDDDYRPLSKILISDFIKDGKYVARYFYHLDKWHGSLRKHTSFDIGAFNTRKFLEANDLTLYMFDSHCPQPIDKRIFLEMLLTFPGIENKSISEWNAYFNYLLSKHPDIVLNTPCATLGWPDIPETWDMEVTPSSYLFENFYSKSYLPGAIFDGCSSCYYDGIERESIEKVARYENRIIIQREAKAAYQCYRELYKKFFKEYPYFKVTITETFCSFTLPKFLYLSEQSWTRIPVVIENNLLNTSIRFQWSISDLKDQLMMVCPERSTTSTTTDTIMAVKSPCGKFSGLFHLIIKIGDRTETGSTGLIVGQNYRFDTTTNNVVPYYE